MSQDFQLFAPVSAAADCIKPLPLNIIHNSTQLYEVITFEEYVDLSQLVEADRAPSEQVGTTALGTIRMALPLAAIHPAYSKFTRPKTIKSIGGGELLVGLEKTFLPGFDTVALRETREKSVWVDDIVALQRGAVFYDGKVVRATDRTVELLENYGEAYAELLDCNEKVKVTLNTEEIVVRNPLSLIRKGKLDYQGTVQTVQLSKLSRRLLAQKGYAMAKVEGRLVRLVVPNMQMARQNANQQVQMIMPGTTAFDPSTLTDTRYCDALNLLLSDERAGVLFRFTTAGDTNELPLSDELYEFALNQFVEDPRFQECASVFNPNLGILIEGVVSPPAPKPDAPKFEIGLLNTYEQTWELRGYSRGALLSSLTLAPNEETEIEVFTWDRLKVEEEQTFGSEFEGNREISVLSRTTSDVAASLSEALTTNAGIQGGISLPVQSVPAEIDANGNLSIQNQVETSLESTLERVDEATRRASEKFRLTHQVKIMQTRETGEETRTKRRLQNQNQSRTLTLNHFEILENHRVTTRIVDSKRWCLLVENPDFRSFDLDFVLALENRLQKVLLSANYKNGFEAAKILAAQRWFEEQSRLKAELENEFNTEVAEPSGNGVPRKGVFATAYNLMGILERFLSLDVEQAITLLADHHTPFNGSNYAADAVRKAEGTFGLYSFWAKLNISYPGFEERAAAFVESTRNQFDREGTEDEIVADLSLLVSNFDDEWLYHVKMVSVSAVIATLSTLAIGPSVALILGPVLIPILTSLVLLHNDNGLPQLLSKARQQVKKYEMRQEAETLMPKGTNSSEADVTDVALSQTPPVPQLYGLRELAEANAEFKKLALHLEAHRVYYQNEIWRTEDPNERNRRLELMNLARFVENRLLGFAGKRAIYPLRYAALPEILKTKLEAALENMNVDDLNARYDRQFEEDEKIVTLPTPAVYMESMLGQCDSLEPYLLARRDIDKDLAAAQKDLALERLEQQRIETERMKLELRQSLLGERE